MSHAKLELGGAKSHLVSATFALKPTCWQPACALSEKVDTTNCAATTTMDFGAQMGVFDVGRGSFADAVVLCCVRTGAIVTTPL